MEVCDKVKEQRIRCSSLFGLLGRAEARIEEMVKKVEHREDQITSNLNYHHQQRDKWEARIAELERERDEERGAKEIALGWHDDVWKNCKELRAELRKLQQAYENALNFRKTDKLQHVVDAARQDHMFCKKESCAVCQFLRDLDDSPICPRCDKIRYEGCECHLNEEQLCDCAMEGHFEENCPEQHKPCKHTGGFYGDGCQVTRCSECGEGVTTAQAAQSSEQPKPQPQGDELEWMPTYRFENMGFDSRVSLTADDWNRMCFQYKALLADKARLDWRERYPHWIGFKSHQDGLNWIVYHPSPHGHVERSRHATYRQAIDDAKEQGDE